MSSRRIGAAGLVALALGATTAAQTPAFRTAANVIAVEASVYDKSGNPVTNLTAADFQIIEDGQTQAPQTIYLVSSDPSIVRGTQTAAKPGELPVSASGESVRRELRPRVLVFVFDLTHLSADGYKRSKTAVESFLKDNANSADLIGILAGGTMLNNKIDTDKPALLKAMSSMKGPNLSRYNDMRTWPRFIEEAEAVAIARMDRETEDRVVQRACSEDPSQCQGAGGNEPVRQQVQGKASEITAGVQRDSSLSLTMFATLANALARLPGSKNVIVFSDGFFTGELMERMKEVVTLAARNDVRFSTMDARGLSRDPRTQNFMGANPMTSANESVTSFSGDRNADVLASLAIDTGGEVIMNRNDLRPGIDIVAKQAGTYYVLGYATTRQMDGKYHSITVKVTRPDVTVRARKGYVAVTAPAPPTSALPSTQPTSALPSTQPTSALPSTQPTSALPVTQPTSAVDPESPPRFRPNSDRNVSALTKVAPGDAESSEVKALADAGWDAYALGDVAVAREKLAAAVATGKAAPWASYALGFAAYALGQYETAATAWTTVHTKVPEFMPVYFDLADAYFSLGRGTDALAILRDAARRWPDEPEAQNALGTTLVKRGALDEALEIFARITVAKPTDSLGFFNLGRTYHLRYLRLQQSAAGARLPSPSSIGEDDRQKALTAYRHYLTLGGPFEKEAKDAIATLDWK